MLATEIWDRRIRVDWMRNYCGHVGHNQSKDFEFCKLIWNIFDECGWYGEVGKYLCISKVYI